MDYDNRFSIVLLEKDILEYREYKEKYSKYENKLKTCLALIYKSEYETKRNFFYNKYIKKMRYLERKYRCNNIYTNYHSQLEGNNALPAYKDENYNIPQAVVIPSAPNLNEIHSTEEYNSNLNY